MTFQRPPDLSTASRDKRPALNPYDAKAMDAYADYCFDRLGDSVATIEDAQARWAFVEREVNETSFPGVDLVLLKNHLLWGYLDLPGSFGFTRTLDQVAAWRSSGYTFGEYCADQALAVNTPGGPSGGNYPPGGYQPPDPVEPPANPDAPPCPEWPEGNAPTFCDAFQALYATTDINGQNYGQYIQVWQSLNGGLKINGWSGAQIATIYKRYVNHYGGNAYQVLARSHDGGAAALIAIKGWPDGRGDPRYPNWSWLVQGMTPEG